MAFTQKDLDALEAALLSPEKTVEFQGRRTTYRDNKEILEAIKIVRADLKSQSGLPSRQIRTNTRRGL